MRWEPLLFQPLDQIGVFGAFFLFGIGLGVYYTAYKLLRYFIRFTQKAIFFQDILFFVTAAVATYMMLMNVDTGEVRGYILVALCLGFTVYYFTLGVLLFAVGKVLIDIFKKVKAFLDRKIVAPVRRFFGKVAGRIFLFGRKKGKQVLQTAKKPFQSLKKVHKKTNRT